MLKPIDTIEIREAVTAEGAMLEVVMEAEGTALEVAKISKFP